MFKKLAKIGGVVLLLAFMVVTLAFTSLEYGQAPCRGVEVLYEADDKITIDKDIIHKIVRGADKELVGKTFDQIDAAMIEAEVEKNPSVQNARVYKVVVKDTGSFKGILTVKVKHREPILRIITSKESYYLDDTGHRFPVSNSSPAHVLIASGNVKEDFAKTELLPCIRFIEEDEFWSAQIEQVYVDNDGDVFLTPLIGDHLIELGSPDNYQEKFRNMKAFYKEVLAKNNWNKYKTISLKYKNQVIAKRR